MTWEEKLAALQCIHYRTALQYEAGEKRWRVYMPGLRTKSGSREDHEQRWGRGATPQAAVEDMWERVTANGNCLIAPVGNGMDGRFFWLPDCYDGPALEIWWRWDHFMWKPHVVQPA